MGDDKDNMAVRRISTLYDNNGNRKQGLIPIEKYSDIPKPSGVKNEYYCKNVNGGNINLNDKSNVKIVSNRHLSKKQSDKIKLFANKVHR